MQAAPQVSRAYIRKYAKKQDREKIKSVQTCQSHAVRTEIFI
jgi:hypothetical protein